MRKPGGLAPLKETWKQHNFEVLNAAMNDSCQFGSFKCVCTTLPWSVLLKYIHLQTWRKAHILQHVLLVNESYCPCCLLRPPFISTPSDKSHKEEPSLSRSCNFPYMVEHWWRSTILQVLLNRLVILWVEPLRFPVSKVSSKWYVVNVSVAIVHQFDVPICKSRSLLSCSNMSGLGIKVMPFS